MSNIEYIKRHCMPSIISEHAVLTGNFDFRDSVEIFGNVNGKITSGIVNIKKGAIVQSELCVAQYIKISGGTFHGNIKARIIHLSMDANVTGSIEYGIITVDTGSNFSGTYSLKQSFLENPDEDFRTVLLQHEGS